eukprot:TRINITY_DN83713_c0_g1_i1.p1 TRINITY_DN83713_c0_g1~~TRINITY_DN83713_c0_g1_i1.p1  ORF type:complete len:346 (+),score=106.48 TRINITY_DN83713_c0_g1_i1:95-1132(+)
MKQGICRKAGLLLCVVNAAKLALGEESISNQDLDFIKDAEAEAAKAAAEAEQSVMLAEATAVPKEMPTVGKESPVLLVSATEGSSQHSRSSNIPVDSVASLAGVAAPMEHLSLFSIEDLAAGGQKKQSKAKLSALQIGTSAKAKTKDVPLVPKEVENEVEEVATKTDKVIYNIAKKISGYDANVRSYGPQSCVSVWRDSSTGTCKMKTDCGMAETEEFADYDMGFRCTNSGKAPALHLYGAGSMAVQETYDSEESCERCLPLTDKKMSAAGEVDEVATEVKQAVSALSEVTNSIGALSKKANKLRGVRSDGKEAVSDIKEAWGVEKEEKAKDSWVGWDPIKKTKK